MRCKVTTVIPGGLSVQFEIADEMKIADGNALAFIDGRLVATLVNAQVVGIGDKWIAIEGSASLGGGKYERRAWWCFLDPEKP